MAERNPKDISQKLRSLTREQAEALYQQLNSAYSPENLPTAEEDRCKEQIKEYARVQGTPSFERGRSCI